MERVKGVRLWPWRAQRRTRYEPPSLPKDEETLLEGEEEDSDEEELGEEQERLAWSRGSVMPMVWTALSVVATLGGRRVLRGGFRYPFYFTFLIQLAAYIIVSIVVVVIRVKNFRRAKRKPEEQYKLWELLVMGLRILVSSAFTGPAILYGAKALMLYENLPVLAMLPILTYACDSICFRLAYTCRILPRGQDISFWRFPKVILVLLGAVLVVGQDYRLDTNTLLYALYSFGLFSLAKVFSKVGPKIDSRGSEDWEFRLQVYLLAGIVPLIMSGFATAKLENLVKAGYIAQSWGITYRLLNIGPAVALQAIFSSSLNSAYPFISEEHIGGALEEPSEPAREAVTSTLQSGFWILVIGVLSRSYTFIDWFQVLAFTLIYVVCVGPKHIGYYPPRVLNIILRICRRRPLPIHAEPWQFRFFLLTTTLVFSALVSTNVLHWVDTIAYNRSLKSFHVPESGPNLDQVYRPPKVRSFDVVIAHSANDPIAAITALMSTVQYNVILNTLSPQIILYSKDIIFNSSSTTPSLDTLRGSFTGDVKIEYLPNTGGTTATHLHHILKTWDALPVQTLFLSTSSLIHDPASLGPLSSHIYQHLTPPAFPLPDALPKTGFLALGPQEVCACHACTDSHGWEDSFHLFPSLFNSARKASADDDECENVLLTYGNNFLASAARIRGLPRDVYQLLYDALTRPDVRNSWAHAREKLPVKLEGEVEGWGGEGGRWGKGGVFEKADSLEEPWLGLTVERLWGVLLQCSEGRIAWECAGFGKGRLGGEKGACGCME